jgi:triacylglycerol esterase/lipase EstA (alpha/beta hydrolase family)
MDPVPGQDLPDAGLSTADATASGDDATAPGDDATTSDGMLAPDSGDPSPDTTLPVKAPCLPAPLSLDRFPKAKRTTNTGRTFTGWGGGATATAATLPPVIFVHSNGGKADDFKPLRKQLCAKGYNDQELWAITFQDPSCWGTCLSGSNTQHAAELAKLVELVRAQTKAKRVALVATSMGVMAARYYLKYLGGAKEVSLAYLVSGPSHGTSYCDTLGASAINVACNEISSATLYKGWLHDLNTPDETPSGQGDAQPAVTYRVLHYNLDSYYLGYYANSPLLKGADNVVLSGASHGVIPPTDLLTYLAKTTKPVP